MASSSTRTLPATTRRPRPQTDVFKPKFPVDPFAASAVREPWFLRPEALPSMAFQSKRDVILVLGAPTLPELDALLSSKLLSNSLLIIATHRSLAIPHTALPAVRILRLTEPLAIEHEGAVRFAVVLEWAQRVARLWRKHGGYGAVELTDDSDGSEHLPPPSIFRFGGSHSTPPSPRASATYLSAGDPRNSSVSHLSSDTRPRPQSLSSKIWSRPRVSSLPFDESQRSFDGLINFLPNDVADKGLLKQAILVTTISANFLAHPIPRYNERSPRRPRASFGALSTHSTASINLPPTPPFQSGESLNMPAFAPTKAHIVHILPGDPRSFSSFTRSKLVQSIESFLISYTYPAALDMKSAPDSRADRALPYIMTTTTLDEKIAPGSSTSTSDSPYNSWPPDCSLLELALCGSLDAEDPHSHASQAHALPRMTPRALLTRASDIVLLAEDSPPPPTVVVSQSEPVGGFGGGQFSGQSTRDSSPSSSASSSPPKTPSSLSYTRSLSPGSPLAKSEQCINLDGLPTPPDSEESGMETEEVSVVPRRRADVSPPSIPGDDTSGVASKSRKMRWRFWKRSTRVSQ